MDDDFFRREYDSGPPKRDNLFIWTIFILLLCGAVITCWLGSFYVFGHPEIAKNYRLLLKIHKLEEPKRFDYTAAPPGDFLTSQKIYEKYATMPDYELQQENSQFLRDFIRNYALSKNPVPYLVGRFPIISSRELNSKDLFSSGVVALARSADYPQVLVEYLYTTTPSNVAQVKATLVPGLEIKSEKTNDLSAILHIEKLADGRLLLTAVPLTYPTYTLKQGSGSFSLDPPLGLHLEGGVPVIKPSLIPPAGKNYAARPAATPGEGETASASPPPANPELIRVLPPLALSTPKPSAQGTPPPAATPMVAQATPPPQPVSTPVVVPIPATPIPKPVAVATPATTPATFAQNITPVPFAAPTPAPGMTPEPVEQTPAPTPLPVVAPDHPDVALQPFIEAKPTPPVTVTGGAWKVFHPGQMPRGRLVKASDAAGLADHGLGGERLYLSGQFTVTASGDNRAVLRAKTGVLTALNPLDHSSSPRIVVEFPAGYAPPAEGSTVTRDELRPFEIRDVQRERDGTVNVMVREVTTPE